MAARPRSVAEHQATLKLLEAHDGNLRAAARATGIAYATLQHRYQAAQAWQATGRAAVAESFSATGDSAELTKTTAERVKTLSDLIRVCEIDTGEWDVERWVCNKWDSAAKLGKDESERITVTELYQVKVWLKRNRPMLLARQEVASLLEDAKAKMPTRKLTIVAKRLPTGILFEPMIPDLHAGKLAWGQETGWEDYDLSTAERIYDAAMDALISRAKGFGADHVVFPVGNDLLHSDTKQGTTTGGTQLDTDSRFHKVFRVVRMMTVRNIDRLREEIGPVKVVLVPGNHDTLSVWHLGESLECWYRGAEGVHVDNAPTLRKYHQHGKVMVMWTHGNRGKLEKYPELMAAEKPEMWGATTFREAHTGDKHHQRVLELKGCKVRISPALCSPDAWHSEFHFVGNQRAAEAFVWHPQEGLIGSTHYTVPREGAA